ncbi:MAG: hypothetical protein SCJ93_04475 [Bacillota bacterium]|nr:hypothetical protein [Bacillota bacterium]
MIKSEISQILNDIENMFTTKNDQYGSKQEQDEFYNFRQQALRTFGNDDPESMYKILKILVDKHLVTLNKNGLDDSNFEERCIDVIVYHIIAIFMHRLKNEKAKDNTKMKIRITSYKPSGKYYTEEIVEKDEDMYLFEDRFKRLVANNMYTCPGGFVTVEDVDYPSQSFHGALYKYEDLIEFKNKEYDAIVITDKNDVVLAIIDDEKIVEQSGGQVDLIKETKNDD